MSNKMVRDVKFRDHFRTRSKFLFFERMVIAGEERFFGWYTWREENLYGEWIPVYWIEK